MATKLLVLHSNDALAQLYSCWLREEGYDVVIAATAVDALEEVRETPPRAVLLSLELKGLDGWETARILRSDPTTSTVAIIAIAGQAAKTRARDGRSAGCNAVLQAPVRRDALVSALRALGLRP